MRGFRVPHLEGLPPFTGGLVGYWGYDTVRWVEPHVPLKKKYDLPFPEAVLMLADAIVAFDRITNKMILIVHAHVTGSPRRAFEEGEARLKILADKLRKETKSPKKSLHRNNPRSSGKVTSNLTQSQFEKMVVKAQEYISEGDIIQAVLSQRFTGSTKSSPLSGYRALRSLNPSPYMFYLSIDDIALVGSSPEVMVRVQPPFAMLRPIAGTRPRGKNRSEDERLARELLSDPKERAEHVMLVDLGRNDLGRVCKPGSVTVPEFMVIERYSHVMHIVSHVQGELKRNILPSEVLSSAFPAGTVSGAPKVRAMEIIDELEPLRRGPYAGAVGYYSFTGSVDTAITIRTILYHKDRYWVQAGAGIVADSVPRREYEETRNKAMGMLQAIQGAEQT